MGARGERWCERGVPSRVPSRAETARARGGAPTGLARGGADGALIAGQGRKCPNTPSAVPAVLRNILCITTLRTTTTYPARPKPFTTTDLSPWPPLRFLRAGVAGWGRGVRGRSLNSVFSQPRPRQRDEEFRNQKGGVLVTNEVCRKLRDQKGRFLVTDGVR